MATTFAAIRDRIKAVVEAADPTSAPCQDHFRYKPENRLTLEEFAATNPGSGCFRTFSVYVIGDSPDDVIGHLESTEVQRVEEALITIAYPRLPDLYGESYESMEDCMRADARQIRDLCISGSTWSAVSGWQAVLRTVIGEPRREGDVWFQTLSLTIQYCESQTTT